MTAGAKADPIVALTADLAPYVDDYLTRYAKSTLGYDLGDLEALEGWDNGIGPVKVLADESGIKERRILAIRKRETMTTSLRVVEQLAYAMGMEYLASELTLYRNPLWSVDSFIRWLGKQGLTPEDVNVKTELAATVPWANQTREGTT